MEILEREPLTVLLMPLVKFQLASDGWASGSRFDAHVLYEKQKQAAGRLGDEITVLGKGLTGRPLDQAGMAAFVQANYYPERTAWFDAYQAAWSQAGIALRLPDRPSAQPRWAHDLISNIPNPEKVIPGVPIYFLAAFAGMLAACFLPGPFRWVQVAWLLAMGATWYAATMVGVTNPRFRFAYEPFCYLYAVAALAWAVAGIRHLAARAHSTSVCTAS